MTSDKRPPRKRKATRPPTAFEAVAGMSEEARRLVGEIPNPLTDLADRIRTLAAGDVDPYLMLGVLLEGMVHVVATRIPAERQPDTVLATLLMLRQRLQHNITDPDRTARCKIVPGDDA